MIGLTSPVIPTFVMKRWLIVDDDVEDQDVFSIALDDAAPGIELLKAGNGVEALEILRSLDDAHLPELIFLDVNMPHMDGKECLREIKNDPALRNIRVIIYTTSSEQRDIDELLEAGAAEFITKPVDIVDLIRILQDIYKKYFNKAS